MENLICTIQSNINSEQTGWREAKSFGVLTFLPACVDFVTNHVHSTREGNGFSRVCPCVQGERSDPTPQNRVTYPPPPSRQG